MRSRRTTHLALALLLPIALVAAACGSDDAGDGDDTTTTTGEDAGGDVDVDIDFSALSGTLTGSGATFPKGFYDEAIVEFQSVAPDLTVTYAGGGSGQGKADLADGVVDWAGTDSLISDDEMDNYDGTVLYIPTVAAPITVSYNLSGVDELQLSPDTIAGIFQGDITAWDAEEIASDNPDADLPDTAITVARRADSSGTTENFTRYLDTASDVWELGTGSTVEWPGDTQAGQGNPGVASIIQDTEGAIGYVDLSDANASGLTYAAVENRSGIYVMPSLEATSAGLDGAEINDDLTYNPLDAEGDDAYPITAPTWVIVMQQQPDAETAENLRGWLTYLLTDAQDFAADIDYARLPPRLQELALEAVDSITG